MSRDIGCWPCANSGLSVVQKNHLEGNIKTYLQQHDKEGNPAQDKTTLDLDPSPNNAGADVISACTPSDPITSGQLSILVWTDPRSTEIRSLSPHLEVVLATSGHILSAELTLKWLG